MNDQPEQLHAVVYGRVQGVNFRAATQREAERLGLAGWVRNREDGAVELLAEGSRTALERLAAYLRRGPPSARVTRVDTEFGAARRESGRFEIRW